MMGTNANSTHFGFIKVFSSTGNLIDRRDMSYCSQLIADVGQNKFLDRIEFYFPNDWLIPKGRNAAFLEFWTSLAAKWFECDIKYKGKFKASDIGPVTIHDFNRTNSYGYEGDKISKECYITNRGCLIMNDVFRGFEIKVKTDRSFTRTMKEYAAFVMVRYLFCDNFHLIVNFFLYLLRLREVEIIPSKFEKFDLFQLSHYYGAEYDCYSNKYSFLGIVKRNNYCYRFVNIKNFVSSLNQNNSILNSAMKLNGVSGILRDDLEKLIVESKFNEIYEKLK